MNNDNINDNKNTSVSGENVLNEQSAEKEACNVAEETAVEIARETSEETVEKNSDDPDREADKTDSEAAENSSEDNVVRSEEGQKAGSIEEKGISAEQVISLRAEGMPVDIEKCFDEKKTKRVFSKLGIGVAIFFAVYLIVSIVIQLAVGIVDEKLLSEQIVLNVISVVSMYLFALPVLITVLLGVPVKVVEKQKMTFGKWMLFLIVSFGLMYIGNYIGQYFMGIVSTFTGFDYGHALETVIDEENIWITAIFTVIIAPIGEEFVFRKLIIDRTRKYGAFISIFLSALIFALMHGNFFQFFYAFLLGLVLGYMYYSTGRLFPTIAIHAVVNFFGSVVAVLLTSGLDEMLNIDPENVEAMAQFLSDNLLRIGILLVFSSFVMASMVCAIVLPIVLRKHIKLEKGEIEIPKGRGFVTVVCNVGMIIMLVIFTLQMLAGLLPV